MAEVTSYFNFNSKECLCTCDYINQGSESDISGDKIPIKINTSNTTHVFLFRPLFGSKFTKEGAVIDSSKIYYQSFNSVTNEYSDPVFCTGATTHLINERYIELHITTESNLYEVLANGSQYITFNQEFIKPVSHVVKITGQLINCTCNYENEENLTYEKRNLIITANEGYEFIGTDFHFIAGDYPEEEPLENYQNRLQYVNERFHLLTFCSDIILDMEYTAYKKPEKLAGFVNIYSPTSEELTSLAKNRFASDSQGNVVDMGQYISNLYVLPFKIPDEVLATEKHAIILGNYTTDTKSAMLMNYYFHISFGVIRVDEKYHNVYDYLNTQCILHLPFLDSVYLNPEYVINQEITIDYTIDLYSGSCTVNIFSSFINDIVESVKGNIYVTIPFLQGITNSVVGNLSGIFQYNKNYAFMEVVRNIPYDIETPFGKPTKDYGKIGDYKGYIKATNIKLESKASIDEKKMIDNLLKNGVFIS